MLRKRLKQSKRVGAHLGIVATFKNSEGYICMVYPNNHEIRTMEIGEVVTLEGQGDTEWELTYMELQLIRIDRKGKITA